MVPHIEEANNYAGVRGLKYLDLRLENQDFSSGFDIFSATSDSLRLPGSKGNNRLATTVSLQVHHPCHAS